MTTGKDLVNRRSEARQARSRYLTQSMQLEESGVPGAVSMGVVATALMVVGALAWAAVTPVEELVRTRGQVIPAGREHGIQHLEGGHVADILVVNGARVSKGDVLVRFSPERVSSELEQGRVRHTRLALEVERLRALDQDRSPDFSSFDQRMSFLVEHQRHLLNAERSRFQSQVAVADGRVVQRQRELMRHRQRSAAIERQLALLEERLQMRVKLNGSGGVSRNDVLALGAQVAEIRSDHEEARGSVLIGEAALDQAQRELEEMRLGERARMRSEMADAMARMAEAEQHLLHHEQRLSRLDVLAPVDGIVKDLRVNSINQVVQPGEVMMTVVPVGDRMVVESRMSAHDVAFVRPGTRAHVAVDSFDVSRFGTVPATVDWVSASTFVERGAEPFYKVQLDLERPNVGEDPRSGQLQPGMTVQASIVTGTKTVLDYLLKPVYRGFRESFHER
jgi:HlyD family type I secretion membrane fusion protein